MQAFLGELVFHPSSSSVEKAFVRRDERRAPLNSPAWETRLGYAIKNWKKTMFQQFWSPVWKLRSLFQCKVKLSARKDSLVVGSPRKYFDFNSLKSPFLGFRVIQTILARFQFGKCFLLLKCISVKLWKPVWIRACYELVSPLVFMLDC